FFMGGALVPPPSRPTRHHRPLVLKSLAVLVGMVAAFFAGYPVAEVAIIGGALLLLTRRVKAEKVYEAVDWPLLVMFGGLFVVVAGFDKAIIGPNAGVLVGRLSLDSVPVLSAVTAVLSNLVSNVPAVLVLEPFVRLLPDPEKTWMVVAMAATLAGNFTLV